MQPGKVIVVQFWACAASVWQGHIHDLLGERGAAMEEYRRALRLDRGQEMRHDQDGIVINRQWIQHRLKTPFERR